MRTIGVALFVFFVVSKAQAQAVDPSIGSYFYFAALDRKCLEKDTLREAKLNEFKQHYVSNMKRLFGSMPNAAQALAKVDDLEKNGPTQMDLEKFDSFFAKGSAQDMKDLCASAAKDIADRMEIERLMVQSYERVKPALDRAAK